MRGRETDYAAGGPAKRQRCVDSFAERRGVQGEGVVIESERIAVSACRGWWLPGQDQWNWWQSVMQARVVTF